MEQCTGALRSMEQCTWHWERARALPKSPRAHSPRFSSPHEEGSRADSVGVSPYTSLRSFVEIPSCAHTGQSARAVRTPRLLTRPDRPSSSMQCTQMRCSALHLATSRLVCDGSIAQQRPDEAGCTRRLHEDEAGCTRRFSLRTCSMRPPAGVGDRLSCSSTSGGQCGGGRYGVCEPSGSPLSESESDEPIDESSLARRGRRTTGWPIPSAMSIAGDAARYGEMW